MSETSQSETRKTGTGETTVSQGEGSQPESGQPMFDFSDAQFVFALRRSMRNIAVLGLIVAGLLTAFYGWRTGLMLVIGAGISFTGVWEWRRLIAAINSRMDANLAPQPLARTILTFLLRLAMVGAVLYGSLRYLEGSVYALIAGLSLAMFTLTVEAFRMPKR